MPYYRRNLYVLSTTVFLAALSWNQVMPFISVFLRDLGASKAGLPYWIGGAFAAQSFASMFAQPFWAKLGDASGRKRMIIRAGLCLSGVYFGMSVCQTPVQLAFLRFLNGALTGFIPGSYALIATNTPEEHAPRSLATAQSMVNAGLIAGPALGGFVAGLTGYRVSMQIAGSAVLLSTLLVLWLVQEPNKPDTVHDSSLLEDFQTSLRSPMQSSLMFVVFMTGTAGLAVGPYLALHLKNLLGNGPDWIVGAVFALPAAAFVLTAHLWSRLGDQVGYQKTIIVGLIAGGLLSIPLVFTHNIWAFGAIYFAAGVWTAAVSPSTAALTCSRVVDSFRGRAYAMQNSATTLGGLVAPLVAARLVASYGYSSVFAYSSAALLIGGFTFPVLVRRWRKNDVLAPIDQG